MKYQDTLGERKNSHKLITQVVMWFYVHGFDLWDPPVMWANVSRNAVGIASTI